MSDTQNGNSSAEDHFSSCTLATCPVDSSYYLYRITLAPNAAFLGIFGLSAILYILTWAVMRKTRFSLAFASALILGLVCEIIGYIGRIMSWQNQWSENGFLIQICCLTIAPAFMSAGVYLCLRRIVGVLGEEKSRIKPVWYTRIFIPCDVVSLVLQALGGGMASVASHNGTSVDAGDNIMIAGLAFQVFTLLVFMILAGDFLVRSYLARGHLHPRSSSLSVSTASSMSFTSLWGPRGFYGFLLALTISTICIFWRCAYRVAELSHGWDGDLMRRENLFVGFEGVMIIIAVCLLNIWHPCFGPLGSLDYIPATQRVSTEEVKGTRSGTGSDIEMGVGR